MEINSWNNTFLADRPEIVIDPDKKPVLARPGEKSPYQGYIPVAPVKEDLRVLTAGAYLEVWGRVLDSSYKEPISHAGIELWHLSPLSGQFKHRAKLTTGTDGVYRFITDLPNRQKGKDYCVYFKVVYDQNSYFTKLSFNNAGLWLSARYIKKQLSFTNPDSFPFSKRAGDRAIFQFDICLQTTS